VVGRWAIPVRRGRDVDDEAVADVASRTPSSLGEVLDADDLDDHTVLGAEVQYLPGRPGAPHGVPMPRA
jgi:hypothetical protein